MLTRRQHTLTHVLWRFSPLKQGLASGSPQQFPPLMHILPPQSTLSCVPLHHPLHCPRPPSHTFHLITHVPASFCNTWPSHLNRFCFKASDTDHHPFLQLCIQQTLPQRLPHIQHTTLISVRSNLALCSTFMDLI